LGRNPVGILVGRAPGAPDAVLPGWFFLDKIFGGRKFKIVKQQKHTPVPRTKPAATPKV
jgi:hypothetical protein